MTPTQRKHFEYVRDEMHGDAEPVAIVHRNEYNEYRLEPHDNFDIKSIPLNVDVSLFKTPQRKPWVELTDGQKDAARYRWLRDMSTPPHNFYLSVPAEFHGVRYKPHEVDAHIDAAIKAATALKSKT